MSARVKGVLAGGALSGIIGVVMGLIPFVSYLCCIIALLGGGLASLIQVKTSEEGVSMGASAVTGALSGLVMFIFMLVIYLPIHLLIMALFTMGGIDNFLDMLRYSWTSMIVGYFIQLVLAVVYCFGFGTVGGIVANLALEDRKPGSTEKKKQSPGPVAMPAPQQPARQIPAAQPTPGYPQTPQTPQGTPQPPYNPGNPGQPPQW